MNASLYELALHATSACLKPCCTIDNFKFLGPTLQQIRAQMLSCSCQSSTCVPAKGMQILPRLMALLICHATQTCT